MTPFCSVFPSQGFHFEFSTNLSLVPIKPACDLHLRYRLPADVFVDKYELEDHRFEFHLLGESNLELPLAAVEIADVKLDVRVPPSKMVIIPLHARYPLPSTSPFSIVRLPEPRAFWACPISKSVDENGLSRTTVPYLSSLDSDSWSIIFCDKANDLRYHEIRVPAGRLADGFLVEFGTAFIVLAAFFYVLHALWKAHVRIRWPPSSKHE